MRYDISGTTMQIVSIDLAEEVARYLPQPRGDGGSGMLGMGVGGVAVGGILGSLLSDN